MVVWLLATNQENPIIASDFPDPIPVTIRGLTGALEPVQGLENRTVVVNLRAPQSSWDGLTVDDFTAYIDVEGLQAGEHDVDVEVRVRDTAVQVQEVEPEQLRVELDAVTQKELPMRIVIMDSPAFGYDAQTPLVEPMTITVSGPATQVEQVIGARGEIFLDGAKSQVDSIVPVELYNGENQPVPQVSAEPSIARVIVPIEQRPGRKEVAVRPLLTGQPADGYRLSSVRVEPSTVVLIGNNETLAAVPGFVETDEVSLAGAVSDIEKRVELVLPDGVAAVEGNTVVINAGIAAIEGGNTIRAEPVVQGLGPGLTATVPIDEVEVILTGPLPMLESLASDDVFVILDLSGLVSGAHTIRPNVVLPSGIRVESVLPETVEVVIELEEGAQPVAPGTVPSQEQPDDPGTPESPVGTSMPDGPSTEPETNRPAASTTPAP